MGGWRWVGNPVTHIGGYWEAGVQGQKGYQRGDWSSHDLGNGLPNYPEDLNACHEMEGVLTDDQLPVYEAWLFRLNNVNPATIFASDTFRIYHATAAQRCEAFLRTIGKWKE